MIAIFGATGNTGGAAARGSIARGRTVRAVARRPEGLRELVKLGAHSQTADMLKIDDMRQALAGAEAAYVLIPPNLGAPDFLAYQGQVTDVLCTALRGSSCRHVVMLSSMGGEHEHGTGPIVGLHRLEGALRRLDGISVLAIRAGYFMENFLANVGMVKATGMLAAPAPAEAQLSLIAAADIGTYAAKRLAALDFEGFEIVNLVGPANLSFARIAVVLGKAVGIPELPFVRVSYGDALGGMVQAGLQRGLAELYVEMYQGAAAGLLAPEPGTPLVRTDTAFESFADRFAAAYRATE